MKYSQSHLCILLHQVCIHHSWLISGPLEASNQRNMVLFSDYFKGTTGHISLKCYWLIRIILWIYLKQNNQHLLKVSWGVADDILLYVCAIGWKHMHRDKLSDTKYDTQTDCIFSEVLILPSLYAATSSCICLLFLEAKTSIRHFSSVPAPWTETTASICHYGKRL